MLKSKQLQFDLHNIGTIKLPFGCGSIYENIKNEIKIFIETLSEEKQDSKEYMNQLNKLKIDIKTEKKPIIFFYETKTIKKN